MSAKLSGSCELSVLTRLTLRLAAAVANDRGAADLLAAGDLTTADHRLVGKAIAAVESGLIRRCRRLGKRAFLR